MSLSLFAAAAILLPLVAGSGIITECSSRLPMSLSTVISDLEAEGVTKLSTACFLTSRGVTSSQRAAFFGVEDTSTTSFGTDSGLCMALGANSVPEIASTAVACGGNLVYYPNTDDLSRGEGLFDSLAPAMERILNSDLGPTELIVVCDGDCASTKQELEQAAAAVMGNLVSPKKVALLKDVFSVIHYVKSAEEALELLESQASEEPSQAQAAIASVVASDFFGTTPTPLGGMSSKDLAAARQLGPAARKALESSLDTVKKMSEGVVVSNFGDLCEAATKRATDDLDAASSASLAASTVGKQIRANLLEEITAELAELSEEQLDLLQLACFDEFKQELSKLRISPVLGTAMKEVADKSVKSFAQRSKKMPVSTGNAKSAYKTQLYEFCAERLLTARASGSFKPIPRKGVTIGLHWLLPKPFGNDYRQEPWMVHATDNLVYIPPDKITDVNPEDVASGDWRRNVVPSPAGNEMLYMQ
jgi:uncharacterized membrane protein